MKTFEDQFPVTQPLVETVATEYGRYYWRYGAEAGDFQQEQYAWLLDHEQKVQTWLEEEGGEKALHRTLRNVCSKLGQELKAQYLGYSAEDVYYYSKGELKALLDAMFHIDEWLNPPVEEGGRSSNSGDPAVGGNWVATLADVSQAYSKLKTADRELLALFHRDDYSNQLLADLNKISKQAMSDRHDAAIRRLHKQLGGGRAGRVHDGDCDHPIDYVGTRRVQSNAAARAKTNSNYSGEDS